MPFMYNTRQQIASDISAAIKHLDLAEKRLYLRMKVKPEEEGKPWYSSLAADRIDLKRITAAKMVLEL